MRIASLHLKAYGPFDGAVLDFERPAAGLQIVHGPNERGKSTAMRAIEALLFGFGRSTADAWDGHYAALRVGAVLDDGVRRIGLMRRKGNQRTLFEFDPVSGAEQPDRPVEQSLIDAMTGGLDARRFAAMHWLDSGQLRGHGRDLLNSGSDLGAALFSAASGLPRLRQVSAALDDAARALFVPRGSVPALNAALREVDESVRAERAAGVRPRDWVERREALERAAARVTQLEGVLDAARVRRAHIERLIGLAPQVGRLEGLRVQLRALEGVPVLPEDAAERIAVWKAAIARAEVTRREALAQVERRRQALDALQVPQAWLDEADAIARLAARQDEHESSRAELPGLASAAGAAVIALRRALAGLAGPDTHGHAPGEPDGSGGADPGAGADPIGDGRRLAGCAETLLPSRAALAEARLRVAARRRDEGRVADARSELARALHTRDEARAALEGTGTPADVAALSAAVEVVSAAGDIEPRIAELRARLDTADAGLARQAAALGAEPADALVRLAPMPLADVERAEATEREQRTALAALAARRDEPAATLPRLEAERTALAARGPILDRDTLEAARCDRDRRLETAFGADSPPALRQALGGLGAAIREVDRIADTRFADAARLADIESLSQRIAQVRAAVAAIDDETARVSAAAADAGRDWAARLAGRGLPVMTPAAHREWSVRHQRLLDALQARDALATELRAAELERDGQVRLLRDAFAASGREAPSLGSPAALLVDGRRRVEAAAEHLRRRRQRTDDCQRAEEDCRRRQAMLDDCEAALTATRDPWCELCGSLGLPADAEADRVDARLGSVDALRDALAAYEGAVRNWREADERRTLFRSDAVALAARVGLDAPDAGDEAAFVDRCRETLAQVRRSRDERLALTAELGQFEREASEAQQRSEEARAGLDALRAQAEAADDGALQRSVTLDAQRRDAQRAAAELDALIRAATGASHDRWVTEAMSADTAGLRVEQETLDRAIRQHEAERDLVLAERTRAQQAFEAIDGGARAAAAAESARERLAAVSRLALDYARLRIARELLERAVQRHAERAQGPMLATAARWFSRLTAGRWVDLRPDWVDDRQVLQAVRTDGTRLDIERLSEGTADALYLALRLAAIDVRAGVAPPVPLLLDDVLMTFDDERATLALQGLAELGQRNQVVYFTHHAHLVDLARRAIPAGHVAVTELLHRPVAT